jgi:N-acetylglutamate synthase-like GNAT family acetyltransferase
MSSASAFALLQNKIKNAVELRGLESDQLLKELHDEAERKLMSDNDSYRGSIQDIEEDTETVREDINLISRAMAYRMATSHDLPKLHKLLNASYKPEIEGNEAFRSDSDAIATETLEFYLTLQSGYKWTLLEVPSQSTCEKEGTILGACCFTTEGRARSNFNSQESLQAGSIRFLGIIPKYLGLCLGRRLLSKVESQMREDGCKVSLANIPSTRISMIDWIQRRGYDPVAEVSYPFEALNHTNKIINDKVTLVQCTKTIASSSNFEQKDTEIKIEHSPKIPSTETKSNNKRIVLSESLDLVHFEQETGKDIGEVLNTVD